MAIVWEHSKLHLHLRCNISVVSGWWRFHLVGQLTTNYLSLFLLLCWKGAWLYSSAELIDVSLFGREVRWSGSFPGAKLSFSSKEGKETSSWTSSLSEWGHWGASVEQGTDRAEVEEIRVVLFLFAPRWVRDSVCCLLFKEKTPISLI